MSSFQMRLTVSGVYNCHDRSINVLATLSNVEVGNGAIKLLIPAASMILNVTYPEPGCDCEQDSPAESLAVLATRLGSPALGGVKTPPNWWGLHKIFCQVLNRVVELDPRFWNSIKFHTMTLQDLFARPCQLGVVLDW